MKMGTGLKLTHWAMVIHSHRKNPLAAIPSTITIIPAMKRMVSQLIPEVAEAGPV